MVLTNMVTNLPPPILYKYYTFEGAYATLKNSMFKFSPIAEFNDSYEAIPAEFNFYEDMNVIAKYILRNLEHGEYSAQEKEKIISCLNNEESRQRLVKQLRENGVDTLSAAKFLSSSYLACCFSECNNSQLMWAHYAQQHMGLCIAIETKQSFIYKKIIYQKERLRLSFREDPQTFQPLLYTKAIDWSYEKEWRLLLPKENSAASFSNGLYLVPMQRTDIKAVYFGLRIHQSQKKEIKALLPGSTTYYQAKEHPTDYNIVFVEDNNL